MTEPQREIPVVYRTQVLVWAADGGHGGGAGGRPRWRADARRRARVVSWAGTGTASLMSLYTLPYDRIYGICRETRGRDGRRRCGPYGDR